MVLYMVLQYLYLITHFIYFKVSWHNFVRMITFSNHQSFPNTYKWIEKVSTEHGSNIIIVFIRNKTDLVEKSWFVMIDVCCFGIFLLDYCNPYVSNICFLQLCGIFLSFDIGMTGQFFVGHTIYEPIFASVIALQFLEDITYA